MLFDLDFAINTILSCSSLFFLIIDLYFFLPIAIAPTFNAIKELVISIGITSKEVKAEVEIHPISPKIRKC